jgi:hypothetical protein
MVFACFIIQSHRRHAETNGRVKMKPKNFPARKLARQIAAKQGVSVRHLPESVELESARAIRTKKDRSSGRVTR